MPKKRKHCHTIATANTQHVSVLCCVNGAASTLPPLIVFMSVKEYYATFKESKPDVKISVCKFAEIRPPNVLFSSETPSNVCQCIYHQKFILALSSIHQYIPDFPSYTRDFPSSYPVSDNDPDCWFSESDHHNCGFFYEGYRNDTPRG